MNDQLKFTTDGNIIGNFEQKIQRAIEIAKTFEPPEGYILAYSGGKDSTVVKAILDMAGVKYKTVYNMTTVDPPELVRHIISQFKGVIYDMSDGSHKYYKVENGRLTKTNKQDLIDNVIHFNIPEKPMRELIVEKQFPPTRIQRYCCERLKESNGIGGITVTGVRKHESANRKKNQSDAVIWATKDAKQIATNIRDNINFTKRGGIILNYDDDDARRIVEQCYRTTITLVNPIVDFTDDEVWEFIRHYNLPYCCLYNEGWKRLGCVGCPLGNFGSMRREFERWPQYKKMYIRAFGKMLEARKQAGKITRNPLWVDGEGVMKWWIGYDQNHNSDQLSIEELAEIGGE